ncbi:hypothetical protein GJ496_007109 [Pomphorhynchus laevis]|nr:hypothetical protein GJ496_007109 [Pomphorhynchus laevis]KAI0981818.1 hypothetical protein GJ496_007109 [Pomphorhynchus laevis]
MSANQRIRCKTDVTNERCDAINAILANLKSTNPNMNKTSNYYTTSVTFPNNFIEFWASSAVSDIDSKIFSDLLSRSQSNEGIMVCDIVEAVKLYIRYKLCTAYQQIVNDFEDLISSKNKVPTIDVHCALRSTRNGRTHMEDYCVIMENVLHPKCNKRKLFFMFEENVYLQRGFALGQCKATDLALAQPVALY